MKKFLTLALALVMALALAAPAMAFATGAGGNLDLGGYEWNFYLVDYTTDSYFDADNVFITDLPSADRGYVTNEVVAAVIECVVPAESYPAGAIDLYVTSEKVSFTTEQSRINSKLANKGVADTGDRDEYALTWNSADARWEFANASAKTEAFVNNSSKAETLQWLVQGRVTGDDASLTLDAKFKVTGGETLKLDGTVGELVSGYRDTIEKKVGDYKYSVTAMAARGTLGAAATTFEGQTFALTTTGYEAATFDGTQKWLADGTATGETVRGGGIYILSSGNLDGLYVIIGFDAKYNCHIMLATDGTSTWVVGKDGALYDITAVTTYAALTNAIVALNVTDGGTTAKALVGELFKLGVNSNLYSTMINGLQKDTAELNDLAGVNRYLSVFDLDPARLGGRALPSHFTNAASNSGSDSWTIEIAPWEAYVSIPDVAVIDPPQTGDAETIAGFVMIVLAAAGVVVFKKVRA